MIGATIVACEIGFWALAIGGLTARYRLGRPRLGAALLAAVPLVDLVLCAVVAVDLAGGATAEWTHGLAAAYLGFSVVFGPGLVRSIDRRFLGEAAPPTRDRDRGPREWRRWRQCALACLLAAGILGGFLLLADDAGRTEVLWANGGWFAELGGICVAWLLFGPVWERAGRQLGRGHARRAS